MKRSIESLESQEHKRALLNLKDAKIKINSEFDNSLHLVLKPQILFKLVAIDKLLLLPQEKEEVEDTE